MYIEQRQVREVVSGSFWKPADELGAHVLFRSAELITEGLVTLDPDLSHRVGGQEQVMDTVLTEIISSPRPEDLMPGAVDLAVDALQHDEPFYIWTAGHYGTFTTDTGEELPGYNNQLRKIAHTRLREDVEEALAADTDTFPDAASARRHRRRLLRPRIGKTEKFSRLDSTRDTKAIFDEMREEGITEAFIADDRQGNLDKALQTASSYNLRHGYEAPVILYTVKVHPEHGQVPDLAGYNAAVNAFRSHNPDTQIAHIVDWDDTLFNERQRVRRIGANLHQHFYPSEE